MISIEYFFGLLGMYSTGQIFHLNHNFLMVAGLLVFFTSLLVISYKKARAGALIVVGLSILFTSSLINAFALSDSWNGNMWGLGLEGVPLNRIYLVGFHGCMLVVCGLFCSLTNDQFSKSSWYFRKNLGALLFLGWFIGVGYLSMAGRISREPNSPLINNSQWQVMARSIDSGVSPLCVPIDPWLKGVNFMYQRNCGLLKEAPIWDGGVALISNPLFFDAKLPATISDKTLVAAAVLVRPFSTSKIFVEAQMAIKLTDGSTKYYSGSRDLVSSGGLLFLTGKDIVQIKNISSIRVTFNVPVEIALDANAPIGIPGIAWMGN